MKKLAAFIAAIMTSMLLCMMPFTSALAAPENCWVNHETYLNDIGHSDFLTGDYYYIFWNTVKDDIWTSACARIPSDNSYEITFENNILDVTSSVDNITLYATNRYMGTQVRTVHKLTFDLTENLGQGKMFSNGNEYNEGFNIEDNIWSMADFGTNLPEMTPPHLDVEVFPELTTNFNYSATYEGNYVPLSAIQVDIINDTNHQFQYAILIQPHDAYLEYDAHSNSRNMSIFWGNSPVTYALVKDEWFYAPFGYQNGMELINAPCAWHHVSPSESSREHLYFEQMQLKKGETYDFKVLSFDLTEYNTDGEPNDLPHYTSSINIEVIYTKTFSVASDTKFNPDSNANGAYSYDNTIPLDSQFDKVKGYYDSARGNVVITEGNDFGGMYSAHNSGATYSDYTNVSNSNNKSFNSLVTNSSSFLSLCKNVFRYMPDWVSELLFAGLIAFILAAIWRKI